MKKRIIKKWINRYITPLVADLPTTITYATEIKLDEHRTVVAARQYVIVNGYIKAEGERTKYKPSVMKAIQRTAELITKIKADHEHVLLRTKAEYSHNYLYIRLITD